MDLCSFKDERQQVCFGDKVCSFRFVSTGFTLSLGVIDNSQDQAMVDFLEGLADHGFQKEVPITAPRQELSGSISCPYNSDEEEAVPELEKEEAELSMMMSQRWDTDIPESSTRYGSLISSLCSF